MGYRVDTVPWPLRPLYLAIAAILGLLVYLYYVLCRFTSDISIEGPGKRDLSQHAIFRMWYESWCSYPAVFIRYQHPHALITYPAAYIKPIHTALRLMGLKRLLLGSSCDEGKQAVNELALLVKTGWSTTISPDGPAGPARVLKKGVLHLALKSGVPIVPLTISATRFRIRVTEEQAVGLSDQNFDEAGRQIVSLL